jgi:hypothetical protein
VIESAWVFSLIAISTQRLAAKDRAGFSRKRVGFQSGPLVTFSPLCDKIDDFGVAVRQFSNCRGLFFAGKRQSLRSLAPRAGFFAATRRSQAVRLRDATKRRGGENFFAGTRHVSSVEIIFRCYATKIEVLEGLHDKNGCLAYKM